MMTEHIINCSAQFTGFKINNEGCRRIIATTFFQIQELKCNLSKTRQFLLCVAFGNSNFLNIFQYQSRSITCRQHMSGKRLLQCPEQRIENK